MPVCSIIAQNSAMQSIRVNIAVNLSPEIINGCGTSTLSIIQILILYTYSNMWLHQSNAYYAKPLLRLIAIILNKSFVGLFKFQMY